MGKTHHTKLFANHNYRKMVLNDHQGKCNRNAAQMKANIIELNTNGAILAQNKSLTQIMDEFVTHNAKA